MTDLPTAITTGLLAFASKDLIKMVLGPTAEYVGQETRGLAQKCNINLSEVFKVAYRKIRQRGTPEEHVVNIRVFKEIVNEGKFSEDPLFQEYYGGILASAKTQDGVDDRGVYYLSLIKSLSVFQLRLHYLLYLKMCLRYQGCPADFLDKIKNREKINVYIPTSLLLTVFGLPSADQSYAYMTHSMMGLSEKLLIGKQAGFVDKHPAEKFENIQGSGMILRPTLLGCETFLWGNGLSQWSGSEIGQADVSMIEQLYSVSEIRIEDS